MDGMEGKIYFTLFDKFIGLEVDKDIPIEYVEKCVQNLNSLNKDIISDICKYSVAFCMDTMEDYDEVNYSNALSKLTCDNDILKFIQPISLTVDVPKHMEISTINLYCKCAWDADNDMQILINNDKVVYVGVYDGLNTWQSNLAEWGNYVSV